jgi:hypothetical protein
VLLLVVQANESKQSRAVSGRKTRRRNRLPLNPRRAGEWQERAQRRVERSSVRSAGPKLSKETETSSFFESEEEEGEKSELYRLTVHWSSRTAYDWVGEGRKSSVGS